MIKTEGQRGRGAGGARGARGARRGPRASEGERWKESGRCKLQGARCKVIWNVDCGL